MDSRFKLIIANNNIYKEVELAPDARQLKVGTGIACDVRLRKEFFFGQIELLFVKNDRGWSVHCSDNLYLSVGDVKKLMTKSLDHGDVLEIKYQESDNLAFSLDFLIDFDDGKKKYERVIDLANAARITAGASNSCNIVLGSSYVRGDEMELTRRGYTYLVDTHKTTYGVYINGRKITDRDILEEGDFISIADYSFYYKEHQLWTQNRSDMFFNGLQYADKPKQNSYPMFKRNTRIKTVLCEDDIEILDPPAKPKKPKNNLLMSLLPSVGMLLAAGIMAYIGGATMLIFSGISTIMAIITSVLGMLQGKQEYEKDIEDRSLKYNAYIDNKCKDIERLRNEEARQLERIYIGCEENRYHFEVFSSDLFDREVGDEDFLHVSLGRGDVEAMQKIKYKKQEKLEIEDELQTLPEKICAEYRQIHNAPIVCDFHKSSAVGVMGDENFRYDILKSTVFDICARQFYTDVKLFFIVDSQNQAIANEFRMLPYVNKELPNNRNIACDEESKKLVFEFIYNELTRRLGNQDKRYVHYVIFFYDLYGFASHPISKFVERASELGVTFVFFAGESAEIPQGCNYLICQKDNQRAELVDTANAALGKEFQYYKVSDETIRSISCLLAPVEAEEISLEGSLTKNIDLFQLLHIFSVDDLDLRARWKGSKVYQSMSVPLGVSKTGIVSLDLHDKAHGPHGLVAGTTGSGKSEILQSYILSIATYFHPYEIGFLIIDFKGGGMVNQFRDLPHLLGAITNIDGKEIDRSLKSIKAELQKRQRLFADAEVNHIDKYIQKFKEGKAAMPLPHLIIIVDEFAELKAEQPDFMKELISAARIGRSLGVHLILATQKPAGQVDDQIWSNSRFKLCLKVQGPEDSNEVLKSPLAAEIKEPGRAYLQVGNNEIFELFQSAYSGAPEKSDAIGAKEYKISQLSLSGRRKTVFEQKKSEKDVKGRSQLEAIVSHVAGYCAKCQIDKLPDICMKSLEHTIMYEEAVKDRQVQLGVYDDPDKQYQGAMFLDIDNRNTFILGAAQYGKTNIIQLLIRQIVSQKTVSEANIYILDFGSLVLKNFEELKHVGGVVCPTDDEKLKNLFKLLQEEIYSRRERLVSVGVISFASYLEAGYKDLPHIYVFVDNMTALMELYLENDETFLGIVREGLAVGISVIMANAQTNGIGLRYMANFANKICLYCNDTNEYGNLFDHVILRPDELPGRCVLEYDKRQLECQAYLAFEGEKEIERVSAIRSFINEVNQNNTGMRAKCIPFIPTVLTPEQFMDGFGAAAEEYKLPIGLSYKEVVPYYLDFARLGAVGLCGKETQAHIGFIKDVIESLNERQAEYPVKVCIFDDVNRGLKECQNIPIVDLYTISTEPVIGLLSEWNHILQERYRQMIDETEMGGNELLFLVIQNNDAAKAIYEDMDAMNQYMDMISRYKALNVCVVFSNYENVNIPYDAPEPIRNIKQERHLLYFDDLDNLKVFDVAYEDLRDNKKKLQADDVYYIKDNSVVKIKLKNSN